MHRLLPFTRGALTAVAAFSAVLTAAPAFAQAACSPGETTIRAGDPRLARATPSAADSMELSMQREGGESQAFGGSSQHVERVRVNGTAALLFVQRSTSTRGVAVDSVWVDARTWAPLRHVAKTPAGSLDVAYANGRVTGRAVRRDTARTVDQALPEGTFDYSVASPAVRALPLCEGAVIHVSGYDPATGSVREAVHRVVGAERVEIGGAPRDVWAVDVQVNGRTVRLHIDRATGRELGWTVPIPGGTMRGTSQLFTPR